MAIFDDYLSFATPAGPSTLPPAGTHLLVTDAPTASANVALYHLFMGASAGGVPIIWVDFRHETLASFETVLRRLGAPLRRVTYIAPSPLPPPLNGAHPPLFDPEPTLKPTVEAVRAALRALSSASSSSPSHPSSIAAPTPSSTPAASTHARPSHPQPTIPTALIVLDGLAELHAMSFSPTAISQAVRALLSDARAARAAFVSTAHEDGALVAHLVRLGPWWRISGISPRSGEVSGEIAALPSPLPSAGTGGGPAVSREKAVQFRLEAAAVRAFPKGTGRGYL